MAVVNMFFQKKH